MTLLDRNTNPIKPGSRVKGYESGVMTFVGIAVWSPQAGHEIVVEAWLPKGEPQTRVRVGATNYRYEVQSKKS